MFYDAEIRIAALTALSGRGANMNWMILPYRRYADFRGRSRRKEFWLFALLMVIGYGVAMILDTVLGLGGDINRYSELEGATYAVGAWGRGGILSLAFMALSFIPSLAVAARRLHDNNRSGWWLLIGLIPLVGSIVLLVFYVQPSWPQPNNWGPVPTDAPALG
jgi:uncharacterized membrane protein YhaH (DUF805 family)